MGTMDSGMESLMEAFIYETTALLEQLDEILMESEKEGSISEDNINEIFRIMHTIKGSAAMMSFSSISNLAHAVEDVFFLIREDPARLEHVSEAIFDLVFQASDFLKQEIEGIQGENYEEKDPSSLIDQLETQANIMNGKAPEPAASASKPEPQKPAQAEPEAAAPSESKTKGGLAKIRVFFDDGSQMENIRAFALMTQLKGHCDVLESDPPHPEKDSSLCSEIVNNGFIVICRPSESLDDVLKVIEESINIKSYELLENEKAPEEKHEEKKQPDMLAKQTPAAQQTKSPASAPAAQQQAKAPVGDSSKNAKQSLISVNQSKLDHLMDLVGELVTVESMVASNPDLRGLKLDNFTKNFRELRKLTDELQDVVMSIRMVPLSGTFQKMKRIVRDMSKKLDKKVELVTYGGETEVDKTINDAIADPFMHMIRNAMDHAIESKQERLALNKPETGQVTLSAKNVGGEILIDIIDDGRGLNAEQILQKAKRNGILVKSESEYTDKEIFQLIMLPGFSTNEEVTEYSGRGVGMDVVRKNVEKVGGSISINSEQNVGTTFTIKIPLTLAIVDGMDISVGDTAFTLPITSIKQSFKVMDKSQVLYDTDGAEMIMIRGECYPIIRLHSLYNIPTETTELQDGIVIQVESGTSIGCIFADRLVGEQQVVVKPFPTFLNKHGLKEKGLSGCTILGDGSISLILDASSLLNRER